MKTYIKKIIRLFIVTATLASAFSLKSFAGGDSYEIYLNDKLIYKQVYKTASGSNDLHLDNLNINDRLVVKYSHCGVPGQTRTIVLRDENNNILKEWKFTDGKNNQSVMVVPVKEILDLKTKATSLKLCYASKQLPEGRVLAAIILDKTKLSKAGNITEENKFGMALLKY